MRPGYACFVAKELAPEIGTDIYHYYLLKELETMDRRELLDEVVRETQKFKEKHITVSGYYGNMIAPVHDEYLYLWNERIKAPDTPRIFIYNGLYDKTGTLYNEIVLLQSMLQRKHVTLHNLENSRVRGYLESLKGMEVKDSDYPALAALGCTITILTQTYHMDQNIHTWDEGSPNPVTGY